MVQEVLISFYVKLNYKEQGKLRTYLTQLTVDLCKDHLRRWSFRALGPKKIR
ncbi:hypothetical protein CSV63_10555 [Sporosarcina sp. P34]|uniref:sigma factor n=1 Tax=Sporosarcina sp. P34 TaxID=2048247 RepID=UPI000C16663B|nr:hypothetical protein CSV63_10555 [Sporosarcina sp. P34]